VRWSLRREALQRGGLREQPHLSSPLTGGCWGLGAGDWGLGEEGRGTELIIEGGVALLRSDDGGGAAPALSRQNGHGARPPLSDGLP